MIVAVHHLLTHACYICMYCIVSDINECVENRDNCEQLCNNRAGAFTCSCRSGYQLDSDGRSCTGKHCVGLNTVVFQESNIISVVTASRQSVMETCYFFTEITLVGVIEFERAVYTVMEDVGSVEACATVRREGSSAVIIFPVNTTAHGK